MISADFTFAPEHRLPYGKITGRTMASVVADPEGADYLRDLLARLAPFKDACRPELDAARIMARDGLAAIASRVFHVIHSDGSSTMYRGGRPS